VVTGFGDRGAREDRQAARGRDVCSRCLASSFRLLLGSDQPGALVSFVAEPAGFLYDLGGFGVGE